MERGIAVMTLAGKNTALTFGVLAAFFWGTHSVIVRYLTGDLHGLTIAVLRLYVATIILFVILKALKVARVGPSRTLPEK